MKIVDLIQGSPEWHAHRTNHFNASDAPAMMGVSPYKSRAQLLRETHTGITEAVDAGTQRRFDDGHRFEALARPLAEKLLGEDLYPCVGVSGKLSASFDGLTMDESTAFEHKSLNDVIRACQTAADLPIYYRVQMEQQLLVSGAGKCLFMATTWDSDDQCTDERRFMYYSDMDLRRQIVNGWDQFASDLDNYQHIEVAAAPVAQAIEDLPALSVSLVGQVTDSNLMQWQGIVKQRIDAINTNLQTDQDFADAEKMVSFLADGEKKLDLVKEQALSQTRSIDELFRAIDSIKEGMRSKRLELDRTVKSRKENIRAEIEARGKREYAEHIAALAKRVRLPNFPAPVADFAGKMKGKRTVLTLNDAVDTELTRVRLEAVDVADRIDINRKVMTELCDPILFPDFAQVCTKAPDDFAALVALRVSQHKEQEEKKSAQKAQAIDTPKAPETKNVQVKAGQEAANSSLAMISQITAELNGMTQAELQQVLDSVRYIRARRAA
jgi:putative phage-type endonuclease